MRRMQYFEDSGRKQKEDDDGYSDESFDGNTFIERKRIDAGSPTICSDEEFYSDDNLASDWVSTLIWEVSRPMI